MRYGRSFRQSTWVVPPLERAGAVGPMHWGGVVAPTDRPVLGMRGYMDTDMGAGLGAISPTAVAAIVVSGGLAIGFIVGVMVLGRL